jgi:protein-tyrosine kinase
MSKIHEALKKAQEERARSVSVREWEQDAPASASAHPPVSVEQPPHSQLSESEPTGAFSLPPLESNPAEPREIRVKPATLPVRELPQGSQYGVKRPWLPDPNVLVLSGSASQVSAAEQFRTLRSRLYSLRETSRMKKILITSAVAGEGKTFVASNIAQAIAREKNRRVLLIDGDLRKTRLHVPFGATLSPGLSDYLREQAQEAEVIQYGEQENLCLIAGGTTTLNASELLSSARMKRLIENLESRFDWIIVDSPPCLPVADAGALAGLCDGVLLVVRARSTAAALLQKARKELQKRNVIGVVLNSVEEAETYGHYHPYGYVYGQTGIAGSNA